jgi:hypothetical protein
MQRWYVLLVLPFAGQVDDHELRETREPPPSVGAGIA